MDRRSFLKRSTAGAVAAYAALRWRAPERPPEGSTGFLVPQQVSEAILAAGPTWWAECEINGVKHRLAEIAGSPGDPEPIDFGDSGDDMVLPPSFHGTPELNMVLWAEESRFLHVLDLVKTGKHVDVMMRLPDRVAPVRVGDPLRLQMRHFEGHVIDIQGPYDRAYIPSFGVTVRMTGLDKQPLPL